MSDQARTGATDGRRVERSTLVITNLIKLAGVVMVVREFVTQRDPVVIGACVVMMSGVQGLENVAMRFLERLFVVDEPK